MKRTLALILAGVLAMPLSGAKAESAGVVYEAEAAQLSGKLALKTDLKASGWKAVGTFEGAEDTLTFTIDIPADGVYHIS